MQHLARRILLLLVLLLNTSLIFLAKTTGELAALRKNYNNNLVRTLNEYDKAVHHSPLAKLPTYIRARFKESLVFRTNIGVVSVRYLDIEQRLTEDEFAQVMSMFGIDTKHGFWGFSRDAAVVKILGESTGVSNREAPSGGDPTGEGSDHKNYICSKTFKHTCEPQVGSVCLSGC